VLAAVLAVAGIAFTFAVRVPPPEPV